MTTKVAFTLPGWPASKKNSRQLSTCGPRCPVCGRGAGLKSRPSSAAAASILEIQLAAARALRSRPPLPEGRRVGLLIEAKVGASAAADSVHVEILDLGPEPEGVRRRRQDLDNLASTVLDALQGFAYQDDRQVALLRVARSGVGPELGYTVEEKERRRADGH